MQRTRAKKARESKRTAAVPKPLTPAQSTAVRQIVKQTADLKYTDFQTVYLLQQLAIYLHF